MLMCINLTSELTPGLILDVVDWEEKCCLSEGPGSSRLQLSSAFWLSVGLEVVTGFIFWQAGRTEESNPWAGAQACLPQENSMCPL